MILNISDNDYANYSHNIANAIRSVGRECIDLCMSEHRFGYITQSFKMESNKMIPYIEQAGIVQVMHSHPYLFELAKRHCRGRVVVYHTGTRYREGFRRFNKLFEGHQTFTDQTEFLALGDHTYVVSPVNIRRSEQKPKARLIFGHFPSNIDVKGTRDILRMMKQFKKPQFKFDSSHVSHSQQLGRMSQVDIYIELFKPEINGHTYGCFGVTALEAGALGKVVITQDLNRDVYESNYGQHPFLVCNTEADFMNTIEHLLSLPPREIVSIQNKTCDIINNNHSLEATGNRIINALNNYESSKSISNNLLSKRQGLSRRGKAKRIQSGLRG